MTRPTRFAPPRASGPTPLPSAPKQAYAALGFRPVAVQRSYWKIVKV